jgi:hypothetical protein
MLKSIGTAIRTYLEQRRRRIIIGYVKDCEAAGRKQALAFLTLQASLSGLEANRLRLIELKADAATIEHIDGVIKRVRSWVDAASQRMKESDQSMSDLRSMVKNLYVR